ncbi:MAG: hypothetical protein HRT88_12375 [Lentisphaeraceae bacterium]|nr:hypothetical protein [Lentisphaeraceae bacterium]
MDKLLDKQISALQEPHFLALYWTTIAEDKEIRYNITNVFDDLKFLKITRTKQSAVSFVDTLKALCFIDVREESNRKNLYLSNYGAQALETLIISQKFKVQHSNYLED